MGYTLTIGEARLRYEPDDLYLTIEAEHATHGDAPDHDEFTKQGNSRSPGYTVWHDVCRETGLHELFYGEGWDSAVGGYKSCRDGFHRERPLLANHPGHAVLCEEDFRMIKEARERRERANGGKPAGFWDEHNVDNGKDPVLARLLWLEFWVRWALDNCKIPIIENT